MKEDNQYNNYDNNGDLFCQNLTHRDQRSLVFHLLYAVDAFDYENSLESVADNFSRGFDVVIPKDSYVFKQAQSIIDDRDKLDKVIQPLLANWRFERLGTATRLIIRFGAWEILHTKTDPVIVINEAVELAKCFAEKDAYKFINGVLDELIKKINSEKENV